MIKITEEKVNSLAPNAAAVSNGRKISQKGGFIKLCISEDESFIYGECSGSGKNPYITSADFINPDEPVFRCSCPSRQFPCKHSIGLMFDYLAGKKFEKCEIPQDILEKREKKQKRQENKEQEKAEDKPKKVNKSAQTKKMKKQIEGLEILEKFIGEILKNGFASLGGNNLKSHKDFAKQMGDYYLPGPQRIINSMILNIEQSKTDTENQMIYYEKIMNCVKQLQSIAKKGKAFLNGKIESGNMDVEDSMLYEYLGNIWKLEQLDELGMYKDNAEIIQLSFDVLKDDAAAEYVDTGYWINLSDGVISKSENIRPFKAVKYIRQDDTMFDCVKVPRLYFYPGELNRRIRYDSFSTREVTQEDRKKIISFAKEDLSKVIKEAKNQLKNVLSEKSVFCLVKFKDILKSGENLILEDNFGNNIRLADKDKTNTLSIIKFLSKEDFLTDKTMLIEIYCDFGTHTLKAVPNAIITEKEILRLIY